MIKDKTELEAMMERVARFQRQVLKLRDSAMSEANYRAAAGGFLAEIDRMTLEIRDYLWSPPPQVADKMALA